MLFSDIKVTHGWYFSDAQDASDYCIPNREWLNTRVSPRVGNGLWKSAGKAPAHKAPRLAIADRVKPLEKKPVLMKRMLVEQVLRSGQLA